MKFWGLLAMVAHTANTTQQNHKNNTTSHKVPIQRESLSLTLAEQGQVYNSKHKPQWLTSKNLRFNFGWLCIQHMQHNKNSRLADFPKSSFFIGHDTDVNISVPT